MPAADFDEKEFLEQLEADMMAKLMAAGGDTGNTAAAAEPSTGFSSKQVDELEKQFDNVGINPEDFFKELLAEAMQKPSPSSSLRSPK